MARTTPDIEDDERTLRNLPEGGHPPGDELEVVSKSRGVYCFAKKVRRPSDAGDSSSTDIGDDQSFNRRNDISIQRRGAKAQSYRVLKWAMHRLKVV